MRNSRSGRTNSPLVFVAMLGGLACSTVAPVDGERVVGKGGRPGDINAGGAEQTNESPGSAARDVGVARASALTGGTSNNGSGGVDETNTGGSPEIAGMSGVVGRDGSAGHAGVATDGSIAGHAGVATDGSIAGHAGVATDGSIAGHAGVAGDGNVAPAHPDWSTACADMDGDWHVQLKLEASSSTSIATHCFVGEEGDEPAFRQEAPGLLGLSLSSADGKCTANLLPEFGGSISAEMSPTADGLEFTPTSLTGIGWCHPMDWQLRKLSLVAGVTPALRLESYVVGFCDDMSFTSNTVWSATLAPGLFAQSLRVKNTSLTGPVCGHPTSAETPLRVLPWHAVSVVKALAIGDVTSSTTAQQDLAAWPLPMAFDHIQLQTEMAHVKLSAAPAATAHVDIVSTNLRASFEGDTLAELATVGSGGIEVLDGKPALHLAGKACWGPIWAAGRLQVTGKQKVVVEVEKVGYDPSNGDAPTSITAILVDSRGTSTATPVWHRLPNSNVRLGTFTLDGQTEVGVELASVSGCTPMMAIVTPDMRVHSIRAE